jgi:hypothetical protein
LVAFDIGDLPKNGNGSGTSRHPSPEPRACGKGGFSPEEIFGVFVRDFSAAKNPAYRIEVCPSLGETPAAIEAFSSAV